MTILTDPSPIVKPTKNKKRKNYYHWSNSVFTLPTVSQSRNTPSEYWDWISQNLFEWRRRVVILTTNRA